MRWWVVIFERKVRKNIKGIEEKKPTDLYIYIKEKLSILHICMYKTELTRLAHLFNLKRGWNNGKNRAGIFSFNLTAMNLPRCINNDVN